MSKNAHITNRGGNGQVLDEVFVVDGKKASYNKWLEEMEKGVGVRQAAVSYNIRNQPGGAVGEARREGYLK